MSNEKKSGQLLIVFVKNILLGKVKTRLAKAVGDFGAFEVYKELVDITEKASTRLKGCDLHIYFSDVVIDSKWPSSAKFVQEGVDLGERMKNAFSHGFQQGYKSIILIGTDLPDMTADIISDGFQKLKVSDAVIGPAYDGGYYLIGMNQLHVSLFENMSWSTETVFNDTTDRLDEVGASYGLTETLNDIDTIEDLKTSSISTKFKHLYELSGGNE